MTNNPPSAQIKPGEYGFPLKLKARYDNFIGGEWVAPADGEYYQNLTPVTGQLLCEVASSGKRDIDLALDAAHKVKDKWAHTSVQDRAAILFKIADRMEQNLELLATAETWDNGKPIRETSAADVPLAIDHFRYFASCIRAQEGGISEVDSENCGLSLPRTVRRGGADYSVELPAADGELENGSRAGGGQLCGAETRTSYPAFCTAANGTRR